MVQEVVTGERVVLRAPHTLRPQGMGHSVTLQTLAVEGGQEMDTKVYNFTVHMYSVTSL